jgi:hypothetical protein
VTQFVTCERAMRWQRLYRLPAPNGQRALRDSGGGARTGGLRRRHLTVEVSVEPVMALSGRKHP